jgi:hypothetical protein
LARRPVPLAEPEIKGNLSLFKDAVFLQRYPYVKEISRSPQHAALGTKNVSDNITGVKADAAAAAADDVNLASLTLEMQCQQLGSRVTQFLGKIRAA